VQLKLEQGISEKSNLHDYGAVIVTTGAKAKPPAIKGRGSIPVWSGLHLWAQSLTLKGKRVLLTDEDGSHRATGLIELLAGLENEIIVVTTEMFCGIKLMDTDDFNFWYQRVKGFNVSFIPHHRVVAIDGCAAVLEERFSGRKQVIPELDAIVCCDPPLPAEELYLKLKSLYPRVYRAGDCVAPRTFGHAIYEGYMTGLSL
jgi:thioredoxin reductase